MVRTMVMAALAGLAFAVTAGAAAAGEATCYNTDEGEYPCWFEPGEGGDFDITADGYTTYFVDITEPGVAWVSAVFPDTDRTVNLPGPYLRQRADPACWRNMETSHEICAW
jgi:hypothetical protein